LSWEKFKKNLFSYQPGTNVINVTTLYKDQDAAVKSYEEAINQFEEKKSIHRHKMAVLTSKFSSLGMHDNCNLSAEF